MVVKEDDFVVNKKVQIGKTVSSSPLKRQAGTLLLLIFMLCGIRCLCLSKHYNVHDRRGMCGSIGNLSFVGGSSPLLLHRP